LAKELFPGHHYVSLEDPDVLALAVEDPRALLRQGQDAMILDEVQRRPELLSYVQGMVDKNKRNGQFVLTGSAQFQLMQGVTQSLAGRSAVFSLLPLSMEELKGEGVSFEAHAWQPPLLKGFYPRLFEQPQEHPLFYRSYLQTFVERDVRQMANISSLPDFQRLLRLIAGRVGQLLNYSALAGELGLSVPTIKSWVHILEASFVVFRLEPYFENFGKRIVKSPKIFFYDTGLLCYLLGIETANQLDRDPLRGHLFENFLLCEWIKYRWNRGKEHRLYFFRDNHGLEVDAVFESGRSLHAVEIKLASTYGAHLIKPLEQFRAIAGDHCQSRALVYTGAALSLSDGLQASPWTEFAPPEL
jgi:predicted AAA+ superfamily ATPase